MSQPQRGLVELGHSLETLDCFDTADLAIWRDQIDSLRHLVDEELIRMRGALQQRAAEHHLSSHFPAMMARFAEREARLRNRAEKLGHPLEES